MALKLNFLGAAGTVTGSKHLLTAGSEQLLIDCGMFQGPKALRLLNWTPPAFDARSLRHILLTHAHMDHAGYLPRLVRDGFSGAIHCTPATREIVEVLLLDAAHLQEEDAEHANRKGSSRHAPALPLFTTKDADQAIRQLHSLEYDEWLDVAPGLRARFHNAGHILGAAFAEVHAQAEGLDRTIVFSGDLGRYDAPLHADPASPPACDVMLIESTYGNRVHDKTPLIDQIRKPFADTIARGGTILIPAFAVARVQVLALEIGRLMDSGDLPRVPMYIDSPMAVEATKIYGRHLTTGELDADVTPNAWHHLYPSQVQLLSTTDESKTLNDMPGPRIIIAPSGMMTGGRVLHHMMRLLPDPKNLVVLAGYQAVGTRGDLVQKGAETLRIYGENVPVRAATMSLEGLSAHADADELMRWLRSGPSLPRRVFTVHGEPEASAALSARIKAELSIPVEAPTMGSEFDLGTE